MAGLDTEGDGPVLALVVEGDAGDGLGKELGSAESVETLAAGNLEAALGLVDGREFDCVVVTDDLPHADAIEVTRAVRGADPGLPVVLTPAEGSEELAAEAVNAGANAYVRRDGDVPVARLETHILDAVAGPDHGGSPAVHERYEKLIHHSTDVVFVVDGDGIYQYVSPAVEDVLGYRPEDLVGQDGFELIHPDDREDAMAEFFLAVEDPDHEPVDEFRAEHRDGSWVWLEVRGRNLLDDPVVDGFVVNARDVTERKEYERRLAEQEQRLRQITENLPNTVIWMTDPSFSSIDYVSPGYEDLWGRPVDELYDDPSSFIQGVHPEDRDRVLDGMVALEGSANAGEVPEMDRAEYRVIHPDGTVRWVHGRTVPVVNDGAVVRWIGLATDVTARKGRERVLEGYETLIQTVPDGVFLLDEDGRMQVVNTAWADMVDVSAEQLEGEPFEVLVEERVVERAVTERFNDLLRELLSDDAERDRGRLVVPARLPDQPDEHVYEAHVGLLPYDEEYRGCAVVVRDVTEKRRSPRPDDDPAR